MGLKELEQMKFRCKITVILIVLITVVSAIAIFLHNNSDAYPDAKVVSKIPANFILIDDAIASDLKDMRYVFFESQIAFCNSSDECVYQTDVRNSDFIVKYKDKYYINKDKYNEFK